jgi:exosome complex component RRP4
VQQFQNDGAASLHTRNLKFGKLRSGCLVEVSPSLILRSKSQFHTLPCGVDITIGINGYLWITIAKPRADDMQLQRLELNEADSLRIYSDENEVPVECCLSEQGD